MPAPSRPAAPYVDDASGAHNTENYNLARMAVLAHAHAGPMTLSAARAYTFLIAGRGAPRHDGDWPPPANALHLAYFMRECNFRVRACVAEERAQLWLLVFVEGMEECYWAQDMRDGHLLSEAEMAVVDFRRLR